MSASLVAVLLDSASIVLILIVVGVGLGIIFGLLGVINMAHGEFLMIGGYASYLVSLSSLGAWPGLLAAPCVGALLGWATERGIVRYLYERPFEGVLATWGLSLLLRESVKAVFGARYKPGDFLVSGTVDVLGVQYPLYRISMMILSLLVVLAVLYLFLKTDFGARVRAVVQNRELAMTTGVDTTRMYQITFMLGSAVAAFAGALIAPLAGLNPYMGLDYLLNSFFVVIVGGVGQVFGPIVGGVFFGETQSWLAFALNSVQGYILTLIAAIIVVAIRPAGILGSTFAKK